MVEMKGVHAAVAERLPEEERIVHPRLGKMAVHGDLHIPYLLVPHLVMGGPYRLDEPVHAACLQHGLAVAHKRGLQARLRVKRLPDHCAVAGPHTVEELVDDGLHPFGRLVSGRLCCNRSGKHQQAKCQYGAKNGTHGVNLTTGRPG